MTVNGKQYSTLFKVIGGFVGFVAAVLTIYSFYVSDNSQGYYQHFEVNKARLINLVSEIEKNEEYKKHKIVPRDVFKRVTIDVIDKESNREKADALVAYLDDVAKCVMDDSRCQINSASEKYDEIMYATWFWLQFYIMEKNESYVGDFGSHLEKWAIEARGRMKTRENRLAH